MTGDIAKRYHSRRGGDFAYCRYRRAYRVSDPEATLWVVAVEVVGSCMPLSVAFLDGVKWWRFVPGLMGGVCGLGIAMGGSHSTESGGGRGVPKLDRMHSFMIP